jgi:hypothetical protein
MEDNISDKMSKKRKFNHIYILVFLLSPQMSENSWGCSSVVACWPRMHKALGSIPNTIKQTKRHVGR